MKFMRQLRLWLVWFTRTHQFISLDLFIVNNFISFQIKMFVFILENNHLLSITFITFISDTKLFKHAFEYRLYQANHVQPKKNTMMIWSIRLNRWEKNVENLLAWATAAIFPAIIIIVNPIVSYLESFFVIFCP